MPKPEPLIEKLRKLQHQRGEVSPFSSHTEFLAWSDTVIPLMSFNQALQKDLKSAVMAANSNHALSCNEGVLSNINRAIGLLNQAVTSLEVNPVPDTAANPTRNNSNTPGDIWQRPIGAIWVILIGGLVLAGAIYLIKTQLGIPL